MNVNNINASFSNFVSLEMGVNEVFEETATTEKEAIFQSESFILVFYCVDCKIILIQRSDISERIELLSIKIILEMYRLNIIEIEEAKFLCEILAKSNIRAYGDMKVNDILTEDIF